MTLQPSFGARARAWLAIALAFALCAASLHRGLVVSAAASSLHPDALYHQPPPITAPNAQTQTHEPYVGRWQRRFSHRSGYLFFKHMRKAGGTAIRNYLFEALTYHGRGTLQQFLDHTEEKEARRHFPFLNSRQRNLAETYYNDTNISLAVNPSQNKVYYIEQEFTAMDWSCRDIDPRWNDSLSVVVLRHPIERHLSEFLYSGPPATANFDGQQYGHWNGKKRVMHRNNLFRIDRAKLYANQTYTHLLSGFLREHLQTWARTKSHNQNLSLYFFRRYTDNFQLRALAGCAAGECSERKEIDDERMDSIVQARPGANANATIVDSVCTMHPFYFGSLGGKGAQCYKDPQVCPNSCDGPCFFPTAPWGPLDERDLSRAIHSLEGFDVVLLTETLDDADQQAFLADALGVPRKIMQPKKGKGNVRTEKKSRREKTHYYRDLMSNLTHLDALVNALIKENKLEIELYQHAVRLNKITTERWKREVNWTNSDIK